MQWRCTIYVCTASGNIIHWSSLMPAFWNSLSIASLSAYTTQRGRHANDQAWNWSICIRIIWWWSLLSVIYCDILWELKWDRLLISNIQPKQTDLLFWLISIQNCNIRLNNLLCFCSVYLKVCLLCFCF